MIIVGIHNTGVTSSAAFVVDGKLVFGCAEERLNRQKHSKYFPHLAIESGLKYIGASMADIDIFAIGWNPAINISSRYRAGHSEWSSHAGERFYSNPNHILPQLEDVDFSHTDQIFYRSGGRDTKIVYVTHHLAHCASSYFTSGFDEAAILSCDGYGERATTVWAKGHGDQIDIIREINFPHSIGQFYSTITQFLGFRPDADEWKVMGASAYGNSTTFYKALRQTIDFDEDADLQLDLSFFEFYNFESKMMFTSRLTDMLGIQRTNDQPMEQHYFDIAAALQKITEEYLFAALTWLRKETSSSNLSLSGGVFMNGVANGKIEKSNIFDQIYIPFSPDDTGNSIGSALWVARIEGEIQPAKHTTSSPYLGNEFDDTEIKSILENSKIKFTEPNDIAYSAAKLIDQGKIVGWFQGRSEFGQRALGSRSILADPRRVEMKDTINNAVKFREPFRPFAPAILAEKAVDYFEDTRQIFTPYMEKVLMVQDEKRSIIPAVVHEDNSARLQTVEKDLHPLFYQLIEHFYQLTDVPVVLNTSFNLNGEPIVETPSDALRTFYTSGMDALAIGSYLVSKIKN